MKERIRNKDNFSGAFRVLPANIEYFILKTKESLRMSPNTRHILLLILHNHAFSHKFKQVYDPKTLKTYGAEGFQLNITKYLLINTYGFSKTNVYQAFNTLEQLQLITKAYLKDGHIEKYFFNPERAWEFYNNWVVEDTALAIWKKDITPKVVDTIHKLHKTRTFKAKYLAKKEVVGLVEEKFVRVGRKHKVEAEKPTEKYDIPYLLEEER